ncbi:hypothetical protein ColTof4_14364 [Colletotrichum tofieldiae]|nr:hypothetical protein ColTof3_14775 [Colletotrichum tofieldiae]GKT81941.1 hypothetical protein ColTof4_14364 [Colletotrichum tofieldiae]
MQPVKAFCDPIRTKFAAETQAATPGIRAKYADSLAELQVKCLLPAENEFLARHQVHQPSQAPGHSDVASIPLHDAYRLLAGEPREPDL